jgi:hypothetical protein
MEHKLFKCKMCGKETIRTSSRQKFCVECGKINVKVWSKKYNKKYVQEHMKEHNEQTKRWAKNHPEYYKGYYAKNREKSLKKTSDWQKKNVDKCRSHNQKYHHMLRNKVIELLGSKCVRCGISDVRCLQIDHINGGGSLHFKSRGTLGLLSDVINDSKRLDKYQLLCANCQWKKRWVNNEHNKVTIKNNCTFNRKRCHSNLKKYIFDLLGNRCYKCGESDVHCLQIDHIHGGGVKEYKKIQAWGIMSKIKNNPECRKDYQLLCANCNWIKRHENKEVSQTVTFI